MVHLKLFQSFPYLTPNPEGPVYYGLYGVDPSTGQYTDYTIYSSRSYSVPSKVDGVDIKLKLITDQEGISWDQKPLKRAFA